MTISEIIATLVAVLTILGTWWKMLSSSKVTTAAIEELKRLGGTGTTGQVNVEKDIIRLDTRQDQVDRDIAQLNADLLREAQIMSNQLDSVHRKIDHIDEKLDKIRDLQFKK